MAAVFIALNTTSADGSAALQKWPLGIEIQ